VDATDYRAIEAKYTVEFRELIKNTPALRPNPEQRQIYEGGLADLNEYVKK
jgi:hypothetical protein